MNLIAKEYVAAKQEPRGVLVLSEMAGAAKEMREALIVNPNDVEDVVGAIHRALTMPPEEQAWRIRAMQERLRRYDARTWAMRFLERLDDAVRCPRISIRRAYRTRTGKRSPGVPEAARRLLLFDYDGTLVSLSVNRRRRCRTAASWESWKGLGSDPTNHVVLVSGRRDGTWRNGSGAPVDAHRGTRRVGPRPRGPGVAFHAPTRRRLEGPLTTCDGAFSRPSPRVFPRGERFLDRMALSFGGCGIRNPRGEGPLDILTTLTANFDLQVLPGNKVVEIRRSGVSKGTHFATHLAREPWGFILAAGDDLTDEALFASLPPSAFSIRVGITASSARLNVESEAAILDLLESLVAATR